MDEAVYDDKLFDELLYTAKTVTGKEFNGCTFRRCNLSESSFINNKFIECVFEECNLSMLKPGKSTLSDVTFKQCKMLGVNFTDCQDFLFSVGFNHCILDYASFMGKKMLKTRFIKSSLKEVSFSQANLAGSLFDDCNFENAVFGGTDLTGANLVTSYNYTIDPDANNIKNAAFSQQGVRGLLSKYGIKIV